MSEATCFDDILAAESESLRRPLAFATAAIVAT
jgi:hypothetical protein